MLCFYILANQRIESLGLNQLGNVGVKGLSLHLVNNVEQQSLPKLLTRMTSFGVKYGGL